MTQNNISIMRLTLNDIGVQLTKEEFDALRRSLTYFQALESCDIDRNNLPADSYWINTKHVLEILESDLTLLSKYTREFKFNELPVSFYFSLIVCLVLYPHNTVDSNDALTVFNLFVRIKLAFTNQGK